MTVTKKFNSVSGDGRRNELESMAPEFGYRASPNGWFTAKNYAGTDANAGTAKAFANAFVARAKVFLTLLGCYEDL